MAPPPPSGLFLQYIYFLMRKDFNAQVYDFLLCSMTHLGGGGTSIDVPFSQITPKSDPDHINFHV